MSFAIRLLETPNNTKCVMKVHYFRGDQRLSLARSSVMNRHMPQTGHLRLESNLWPLTNTRHQKTHHKSAFNIHIIDARSVRSVLCACDMVELVTRGPVAFGDGPMFVLAQIACAVPIRLLDPTQKWMQHGIIVRKRHVSIPKTTRNMDPFPILRSSIRSPTIGTQFTQWEFMFFVKKSLESFHVLLVSFGIIFLLCDTSTTGGDMNCTQPKIAANWSFHSPRTPCTQSNAHACTLKTTT